MSNLLRTALRPVVRSVLANSQVVLSHTGTVHSLPVVVDGGAPAGRMWLAVLDAAQLSDVNGRTFVDATNPPTPLANLPTGKVAALLVAQFVHVAAVDDNLDLSEQLGGVAVANGCTVVLISAADTVTPVAGSWLAIPGARVLP
jgi:hypothetical protein